MTAVDRNKRGNVVRREIINVDSEFRVVNAMNVEIPDQAMPKAKAIPNRRTRPMSPVATPTPSAKASTRITVV